MQRAPWLWLATFLAVSLICWISYEGVRTQRHFLLRDVPMAVSTPPSTPSTSSPSSPPSFPLPVLDSIFKPAKAVVSQGKGDTFAVVSRMWRGDLPFLESWLRYYFVQLRVNRVYGILTEQSDLAPLRALSLRAGFGNQLQLWVKDLTNQSIDTSVFDASQIPETFILSIDTDEFVALPVGQNLHSAIAAEPFADIFQLKWRCAPNDTLTEELIPRVGLRCPGYKVMFRTSRFKSFAGPHNINCRRKCKGARKQLVLIHLWYRGVYDALFRQSAGHTQSSFSDRNTGVEIVIADLRRGTLPQRLKHLAMGAVCQEWLGPQTRNPKIFELRDLYGDPMPEGTVIYPPDVFMNQTEQLRQLESLGIDEDLRKTAVQEYHQFKEVFTEALHKMICNPEFFCTRPIMPMIEYAKNMTLEFMLNFRGPCKKFTRAV